MTPVVVENPPSLKAILGMLVVMFGGAGLAALAWAVLDDLPVFLRVVLLAIGGGAAWIAGIGVLLLRYANHRLELLDDGVRIHAGGRATTLDWSALDFRAQDGLQVVHLFDRTGQRVYAVDYWAFNADRLLARLAERDAQVAGFGGAAPRATRRRPTPVPTRQSLGHWAFHALLGVPAIAGGIAMFVLFDADMGIVPESTLLAAEGRVDWIEKDKYGVDFGLEGVERDFSFPNKGGNAGGIHDALAGAGDAIVRVRFEPDSHGPMHSDVRYHDVWEVAVGDDVVRTYAETVDGYRHDNTFMPWLAGFFAFGGVFLLCTAWLARDHGKARRSQAGIAP